MKASRSTTPFSRCRPMSGTPSRSAPIGTWRRSAMLDRAQNPSFAKLLQQFFVDHLGQQKAVSRHTIAAYRDTFQLLLQFAQVAIRKAPTDLTMGELECCPDPRVP